MSLHLEPHQRNWSNLSFPNILCDANYIIYCHFYDKDAYVISVFFFLYSFFECLFMRSECVEDFREEMMAV